MSMFSKNHCSRIKIAFRLGCRKATTTIPQCSGCNSGTVRRQLPRPPTWESFHPTGFSCHRKIVRRILKPRKRSGKVKHCGNVLRRNAGIILKDRLYRITSGKCTKNLGHKDSCASDHRTAMTDIRVDFYSFVHIVFQISVAYQSFYGWTDGLQAFSTAEKYSILFRRGQAPLETKRHLFRSPSGYQSRKQDANQNGNGDSGAI